MLGYTSTKMNVEISIEEFNEPKFVMNVVMLLGIQADPLLALSMKAGVQPLQNNAALKHVRVGVQ